jgi:hypothetical protein
VSSEKIRRLPMKKAGFILAASLLLLTSLPSFAQQAYSSATNPKDAYYKVVPLLKVWMHPLGYMAQYWTSKSQVAQIYFPYTWFNQGVNSKADLVYSQDSGVPYVTIFWVDGKFDHVKLYVQDSYESLSWGILNGAADLSSQFNVQEVPKEF